MCTIWVVLARFICKIFFKVPMEEAWLTRMVCARHTQVDDIPWDQVFTRANLRGLPSKTWRNLRRRMRVTCMRPECECRRKGRWFESRLISGWPDRRTKPVWRKTVSRRLMCRSIKQKFSLFIRWPLFNNDYFWREREAKVSLGI